MKLHPILQVMKLRLMLRVWFRMEKKNVTVQVKVLLFCMVLVLVVGVVVGDTSDDLDVKLNQVSGNVVILGNGNHYRTETVINIYKSEEKVENLFSTLNLDEVNELWTKELTDDQKSNSLKYLSKEQTTKLFEKEVSGLDRIEGDLKFDSETGMIQKADGTNLLNTKAQGITKAQYYNDHMFLKTEKGELILGEGHTATKSENDNSFTVTRPDGSEVNVALGEGGKAYFGSGFGESLKGGTHVWGEGTKITFPDGSSVSSSSSFATKDGTPYGWVNELGNGAYEFIGEARLKIGEGTTEDSSGTFVPVRNLGSKPIVAGTLSPGQIADSQELQKPYMSFSRSEDGVLTIDTLGTAGKATLKLPEGDFEITQNSDGVRVYGEEGKQYLAVVGGDGKGQATVQDGTYVPREGAVADSQNGRIGSGGSGEAELASAETDSGEVSVEGGGCEGGVCGVDRLQSDEDSDSVRGVRLPGEGQQSAIGNFLGRGGEISESRPSFYLSQNTDKQTLRSAPYTDKLSDSQIDFIKSDIANGQNIRVVAGRSGCGNCNSWAENNIGSYNILKVNADINGRGSAWKYLIDNGWSVSQPYGSNVLPYVFSPPRK